MGSIYSTYFCKNQAEEIEFKEEGNNNQDNSLEKPNEPYSDAQPTQEQPENDTKTALHSEGNKCRDLANVCIQVGEHQKAIEYYEKALNIAQEKGDKKEEGDVYEKLGAVNNDIGEFQNAEVFYNKAIAIAQELSDKNLEKKLYLGLAKAHTNRGQHKEALEYYQKSDVVGPKVHKNQCLQETHSNAGQQQIARTARFKAKSIPRTGREKSQGESSNEYRKKAITLAHSKARGDQKQPEDAHDVPPNIHKNFAGKKIQSIAEGPSAQGKPPGVIKPMYSYVDIVLY